MKMIEKNMIERFRSGPFLKTQNKERFSN